MRLLVIALTVSLTGCSIFLTHGPSDPSPSSGPTPVAQPAPNCTTSMTWPAIDGTIAGLTTLLLISAISNDKPGDQTDNVSSDAVTSAVLIAGTAAAGAIIGYQRVSKCRKANEQFSATYPYGGQPQPQQVGYPYAQQDPAQPQPYPAQQYPAQQYPPQQYPTQQPTPQAQPYAPPAPVGPPPLPATPVPAPKTPPVVAQPTPKPPAPKPAPAVDAGLGTEGDVCTGPSECSTGLTCTQNVSLKPKPPAAQPRK